MKRAANAIHQPQNGLHWHWEQMLEAAKASRGGMLKVLHTELFRDDDPRFLLTGGSADNANWYGKLRALAPDLFIVIRLYHPAWWTLDPVAYADHYVALLSRWRGHGYPDADLWMDPLVAVCPANEQNIERAIDTGAACSWWNMPGPSDAQKVAQATVEYKKIAAWNKAFAERVNELRPNRRALLVWPALAQGHDCRVDAPESEYQIPEMIEAIRLYDLFNTHPYAHWNESPPAKDGPGQPDQYWGLMRDHRPKGWRDTHQPGRPADPGGALALFPAMPYINGEIGTFVHDQPARAADNVAAIRELWKRAAATGRCLGSAVYIWHGGDDHRQNVVMHSPAMREGLAAAPAFEAEVAWPVARRGAPAPAPSPVPVPVPSPSPVPPAPAPNAPGVEPRIQVLVGEKSWYAVVRRCKPGTATKADVERLQAANPDAVATGLKTAAWLRSPWHRIERAS